MRLSLTLGHPNQPGGEGRLWMSIRIMSKCWEIPLDPASKLVLLGLADHANDAGKGIYPGNARLARKVSLKVRQTQNLLAHLEGHGLIRREKYAGGGRGKAVEWSINVPLLALLETMHSVTPITENHALCDQKGCNVAQETMHWDTSQPSGIIINRADFENENLPELLPGESRWQQALRLAKA